VACIDRALTDYGSSSRVEICSVFPFCEHRTGLVSLTLVFITWTHT
jgi:hypothetical protein